MPGVRALDTDVGGLSRAEASERLHLPSAQVLDRSLVLSTGQWQQTTTVRELGLRMDPVELAQAAFLVGRSDDPFSRLFDQLGALLLGRSIGALGSGDRSAIEAYLRRQATAINRPAQDASLSLAADYQPRFTSARKGVQLDIQASAEAVSEALAQRQERVELAVAELEPAVGDEQLQPARRELEKMLAGPLVLSFQEQQWRLELSELAGWLSLEVRPGVPGSVRVDEAGLRRRVEQVARQVKREPLDARFDWTRSGLKLLRESQDGRELDVEQAVKSTLEGLRNGQRQLTLPVRVTAAAVASGDVQRMEIRELIEQGQTSFAGSIEEKKHNIRLAAERLNGVVVPPGGLFSFNKEVGPTTLEAGFKWGFGITSTGNQIETVPSVAGGICQVATTLFQPVFWAGYQLEERHWHLYWIPAYTSRGVVGLDVTVDADSGLDFKFINPTQTYVLVQAWTQGDTLHFALYGQKPAWKVETDAPVITNRVPADGEMVFEAEPTLPWGRRLQVEAAREGFDVTVVRRVISGDVRTLSLKSTYRPSRNVTLIGTQGAPAGQDVEALLARLRAGESAENKPVRGESGQAGEQGTPKPTPQRTPAAPAGTPSPRATLTPTRPPQQATATPVRATATVAATPRAAATPTVKKP